MSDEPIAYREDGRPIYDNTPTVVCLAILDVRTTVPKILQIQRSTNPGKGLWALPGGYHMAGESWQMAGSREAEEEVGLTITPSDIKLHNVSTDHYGNNVIFGVYRISTPYPITPKINVDEVLSCDWVTMNQLVANAGRWAFPLHLLTAYQVLKKEIDNAKLAVALKE